MDSNGVKTLGDHRSGSGPHKGTAISCGYRPSWFRAHRFFIPRGVPRVYPTLPNSNARPTRAHGYSFHNTPVLLFFQISFAILVVSKSKSFFQSLLTRVNNITLFGSEKKARSTRNIESSTRKKKKTNLGRVLLLRSKFRH